MLAIVGNRIYLYEGNHCAFKFQYRDSEGDIFNFNPSDVLYFFIRDRESKEVVYTKTAEFLNIKEEAVAVFTFTPSDGIVSGDYIYDIVLENSGFMYTLVDDAKLHVLSDDGVPGSSYPGDISLGRIDSDTTIYINNVPLICNFNYTEIEKETMDGSLILF